MNELLYNVCVIALAAALTCIVSTRHPRVTLKHRRFAMMLLTGLVVGYTMGLIL